VFAVLLPLSVGNCSDMFAKMLPQVCFSNEPLDIFWSKCHYDTNIVKPKTFL